VRKSLSGGYFFKRQSLGAGQDRFKDAPVKNEHSHVGDAFGYMCLGGGEQRRLRGRGVMGQGVAVGTSTAKMDFDIF
jgi:hypothetical protein